MDNNLQKCACPNCPGNCPIATQRCKKCLVEKPLDQFNAGRKTCKVCRKAYNAGRYRMRKQQKIQLAPVDEGSESSVPRPCEIEIQQNLQLDSED